MFQIVAAVARSTCSAYVAIPPACAFVTIAAAADDHVRSKVSSQPVARREPKGRISWLRSGTGAEGHESHVICVEQRPKR